MTDISFQFSVFNKYGWISFLFKLGNELTGTQIEPEWIVKTKLNW